MLLSAKSLTPSPLLWCAVPLTVFLLDYCIRYPTITLTDVAANELEVGFWDVQIQHKQA